MKKEIKIVVPTDYSAVSLKKYLQIQLDLEQYSDDDDAQNAFLVWNLCGLTPNMTNALDNETLQNIIVDLKQLLNKQDFDLTRIVEIEGIKYGFEPNLAKMSYGSYLDLTRFKEISINDDWASIMSILYRPVTKQKGALYEVEPYKGEEPKNKDKWLSVNMDVHFGCFFFFNRISHLLLKDTLNSSKETLEMEVTHPFINTIFQKSGEAIQALFPSQTKI